MGLTRAIVFGLNKAEVKVGKNVRASVRDSYYGQHDANWLGFYDYFKEVFSLDEQTQKLFGLWKISQNAGWWLPHKHICWVSERHNIVKQDGREEIMIEKNSEISRAMAERLGWKEYMKGAETILIDKWFDPDQVLHYELYGFKKRFEMTPCLLKMESPEILDGIRPYYIEPVHPGLKSCQAARRWQFLKPNGKWPSVGECNIDPELRFEIEA